MKKYEAITSNLCSIQALLAYWGSDAHRDALILAPKRICSRLKPESGSSAWIALRWYPALLLLYTGGIAAVAGNRYDNLRLLMHTIVSDPDRARGEIDFVGAVTSALSGFSEGFKFLPGHERNRVPRSEYFFKSLQPALDDLLFLGSDYESHFDRFEVLLALESIERHGWGPIGRFGWKVRSVEYSSPLQGVIAEAEAQGDSWPPLVAGLFKGSAQRFKEIATAYSEAVKKMGWC